MDWKKFGKILQAVGQTAGNVSGIGHQAQQASQARTREDTFKNALLQYMDREKMMQPQSTFYGEEAAAPQTEELMYPEKKMGSSQLMSLIGLRQPKAKSYYGGKTRTDRLNSYLNSLKGQKALALPGSNEDRELTQEIGQVRQEINKLLKVPQRKTEKKLGLPPGYK